MKYLWLAQRNDEQKTFDRLLALFQDLVLEDPDEAFPGKNIRYVRNASNRRCIRNIRKIRKVRNKVITRKIRNTEYNKN